MGKIFETTLTKEDIQMANKHMKIYSTSSVIMKMQVEITILSHYLLE